MNSIQRVMNLLTGQKVDRKPVFAVLNILTATLNKLDLHKVYSDADTYCSLQELVIDRFQTDLVINPFDYSIIGEAFGSEVSWFTNQAPNIRKPIIRKPEEFLKLPYPDFYKTKRMPFMLECNRLLSNKFKNIAPVFTVVPGPFSIPALIMGMENWIDTFLFEENLTKDIMNISIRFFTEWCNLLISEGSMGVIVTEGFFSSQIINRDLYIPRVDPIIKEVFSNIGGPLICHHTGGNIQHIYDKIEEMPNVLGLAISSKDNLEYAVNEIKKDLLLIGNIDNLSFPSLSAEDVYQQSLNLCKTAGNKKKYILCNSGADIPYNTPERNIAAMIKAAMDYTTGSYE